ncbi:MAG: glycosyltransferase, exosortase A system-associated [Gammaproteobacteria bacterium]|nr:glycosyltransferase, exosortase A system-associated [Gammaproteobacteria bacterium]
MKVMHLLDLSRPSVNGYSSRSDAIIRNLRELGIKTCQLTSQKYDKFNELEEDIDGIKYYRTTKAKGLFVKIPLLSYLDFVRHMTERALEIIDKEKPDVIHAHSPMTNGLVALNIRKKTGIPVLYEVRAFWEDAAVDTGKIKEWGLQYWIIRFIEQYVFKRVDKISCICNGLKKEIIKRGISSNKLIIAPNSVDLTKFVKIEKKNQELEKELALKGKKVIAFLGSFFKYEGLEYLIKALPEIIAKIPEAHVLLVGGGNEFENLRALVNKLELNDRVTFTGRINYSDINKYYSLVDLLVFPREDIRLTRLVTPLKPLEAMAQGIPVAASSIGGHKEMVEHNKTGLLFEPENPSALASTIISAFNNEALLSELVTNGHKYVEQVRNWRSTASVYLPAYEELVQ